MICHPQSITCDLSSTVYQFWSVIHSLSLVICHPQSITCDLSSPVYQMWSFVSSLSLVICWYESVPCDKLSASCSCDKLTLVYHLTFVVPSFSSNHRLLARVPLTLFFKTEQLIAPIFNKSCILYQIIENAFISYFLFKLATDSSSVVNLKPDSGADRPIH